MVHIYLSVYVYDRAGLMMTHVKDEQREGKDKNVM